MRHRIKKKKLNRSSSHRKAMLSNMSTSLIINEQIKTTLAKAKALRPYMERLVTMAKNGKCYTKSGIISYISDKNARDKLTSVVSSRYNERSGGYLRIVKDGFRYGDMAPMAYIEFVDRDLNAKGCVTHKKLEKVTQE